MHDLKVSKATAGLIPAKRDVVAMVFLRILVDWLKEDPSLWVRNVETAYNHTNSDGTTIGLFSNLAAKLGKPVDELPFFQIEAGRLPQKVVEGVWHKDFGVGAYFGDHLESVRRMLVPFFAYASLLSRGNGNRLCRVEVGDLTKEQPLIVVFKCPRTLVKLAIYGHILVKEAAMIASVQNRVKTFVLAEDAGKLLKDSTPEIIVGMLQSNPDRYVTSPLMKGEEVYGYLRNPRVEDSRIVVDVEFLDPDDAEKPFTAHLLFSITMAKSKKPKVKQPSTNSNPSCRITLSL